MKKIFSLFLSILVCLILFMGAETTYAKSLEDNSLKPTSGVSSTNPNYGEGSIQNNDFSIQSTNYLMDGTCFIEKNSSTQISVGGKTTSYSSVNTIAVDLYLQKWDSTNAYWREVLNVGGFREYYTSMVYGSKYINVPSGYYYRTRAVHWINQGGFIEQKTCYSSYIYVN